MGDGGGGAESGAAALCGALLRLYCALLRLYCALLRLVAPLLRLVAPCCALLRLYCALMRFVARTERKRRQAAPFWRIKIRPRVRRIASYCALLRHLVALQVRVKNRPRVRRIAPYCALQVRVAGGRWALLGCRLGALYCTLLRVLHVLRLIGYY